MMKYILLLLICLLVNYKSFAQSVSVIEQGRATSIRGLSAVNDKIIWVSGSKGNVGVSRNGGLTWVWQQVKGFEQSDFRDIEAFSSKEAVIMSSGTPALILRTTDGGVNWNVCYRNNDKAYFLDGLAFYNKKRGIAMGDPINGRFVLLETVDGGNTWTELNTGPNAIDKEAAFAASGTSVNIIDKNANAVLLTGGAVSRLWVSNAELSSWTAVNVPLAHGGASKGGFSIAQGNNRTVLVGGNYSSDKRTDSVACFYEGKLTKDKSLCPSSAMPQGYQSCVTYVNKQVFLSTGTSGTNITYDGGVTWKLVDKGSYNVCKASKNGNLIVLAGEKGRIALFKF
jgi:photosystem II stability/assembly factor-like uncharacterized protein